MNKDEHDPFESDAAPARRQPHTAETSARAVGTEATTNGEEGATLSVSDEVADDTLTAHWTKFEGMDVVQKLEQAKLMSFGERDAYLRDRCKVARMECAAAMSALDRATAVIEDNLPFFVVHFKELDRRGHRSDLQGKVISKSEWLKQNVPNITRGTFYDALNRVKTRYVEQQKLLLGEGTSQDAEQEETTSHAKNLTKPNPSPKLKLTQRDVNRLIEVGREAVRAAQIGLKDEKNEDDYRVLRDSCRKITKLAEPKKLDSMMDESAKEAEADIQRAKAVNAAKRLAELTLGWCKVSSNRVPPYSMLLRIGQAAQSVMNLINGTHDNFGLPQIDSPAKRQQAGGRRIKHRKMARLAVNRKTPPSSHAKAQTSADAAPLSKEVKRKPAGTQVLPVTVVVAKPGFTCKFHSQDCHIDSVSTDGMSANLRVAKTGEELRMVPVAELRYIADLDESGRR